MELNREAIQLIEKLTSPFHILNHMTTYHQLSEIEVIDRVISGDNALFEVLIRRYNPYLYKVGRSYGYFHQDVEDLMQDTFIQAFENLGKLREKSYFKTWLMRIMLNECYRKKHKVRLNRAKVMLKKEVAKMYSAEEIFQFNLIYCDKIVSYVMKVIMQ